MKLKSIVVGILLLGNGPAAFAIDSNASSSNPNQLASESCGVIPKGFALYGYTDFNYDSNDALNFYNMQGHANTYALGADNYQVRSDLYAGVLLYKVDTSLDWQMSLVPGAASTTSQTIHNYTLYGHVLKAFNPHVYLDTGFGYGVNQVTNTGLAIAPGETAFAEYRASNWLVNVNGILRETWKDYDFTANVGAFYSQINTGAYNVTITPTPVPPTIFAIDPLENRVTMLVQNIEIGKQFTPHVRPFINGGLFEVIQFDNNRPVIFTPVAGTLPQLLMDENGFRLGGGLGFNFNPVNVRVEEKYYNAGGNYTSWQTLVTASVALD